MPHERKYLLLSNGIAAFIRAFPRLRILAKGRLDAAVLAGKPAGESQLAHTRNLGADG
jgi:hypothetical protein